MLFAQRLNATIPIYCKISISSNGSRKSNNNCKLATITIAVVVVVAVMLAIELVAALLRVREGVRDTISAPTSFTLPTTFAILTLKNFTANNLQQTHYQHEHFEKVLEGYRYSEY